MKKVTTLILMLCLVLWGALCYAHSVARTETKEDEIPAIAIIKTNCGGIDKSGSILPSINENLLTKVSLQANGLKNRIIIYCFLCLID